MKCECGGPSGVVDTREGDGGTYRRRRCRTCRKSWVTIESRRSEVLVLTRREAHAVLTGRACREFTPSPHRE